MLIIPAIDLQDGCVVRLVQGKFNKKVYSRDALKTAKHWVRQGAKFLHLVDLDGAVSGKPKNLSIIKEIARGVDIPVECGGGIRSIEAIKSILNSGVARVVLGTKAATDKEFLKKALRQFKNKVIISVDARGSNVCIKGWEDKTRLVALSFIKDLKKMGVATIIYTDISKDGTLKGPNIKDTKNLLKASGIKIIVSGGVSSLDDILRLKVLEKQGVAGIIIGKALYEGKFTLTQALKFA